eukprot:2133591-Rhodomonas_salina.1
MLSPSYTPDRTDEECYGSMLDPRPWTLHHTLAPRPWTLDPKSCTLHPRIQILHPRPSDLDPTLYTLDPSAKSPSTFDTNP